MSKTPNYDAKIKTLLDETKLGERTCPLTGEKWNFDEREMGWCRKFNAPRMDYSPRTLMQIFLSFRTAYEIFWNRHANSGEPILSYLHPDVPVPVVNDNEWHNMDVDAHPEYQVDHDLSQPLLPQMTNLVKKVPIGARRETKNVINTIGVGMWDVEDCYMVFSTVGVKRCLYTYYCLEGSEDVMQSVFVQSSQNCFGATRVERSHSCKVALESRDCLHCNFVFDCRNCEDCFGATNLRNAKYVFFNEQLSKDAYEKRVAEIDLCCRSTFEEYYRRFVELVESSPFPETFNINSPDCRGEYLFDCVRTTDSYYMLKCTDCSYNYGSKNSENCVYVATTYPGTNIWMSAQIWHCNDIKYSMNCGWSQNLEYCYNCHDCENCFGCSSLRQKKFHIFNKPYTEEEYWRRVDEIKCAMLNHGEYGEFFPLEVSPNGTQFSMAAVLYDLGDEEMEKIGAPMYDPDRGAVLAPKKGQETPPLNIADVPDCVGDVESSAWLGKPFIDASVNRRWAVVPQELAYLKAHKLPFPREHYSSRLRRQVQMLNLIDTEDTVCASCQKQLKVHKNKTFKNRKIYCQPCYLKYLETR